MTGGDGEVSKSRPAHPTARHRHEQQLSRPLRRAYDRRQPQPSSIRARSRDIPRTRAIDALPYYIKPLTPRLNGKVCDHTASTPKSSTPCSTASSSTTPKSSTTNSESGRTTTTTMPPRRPQRPDTLRTTTRENPDPPVTDERQPHTVSPTQVRSHFRTNCGP